MTAPIRLMAAVALSLLASARPVLAQGAPLPEGVPPATSQAPREAERHPGPPSESDPDLEPPPWDEGEPVPPGFHVETAPMLAMATTGGIVLGVTTIAGGVIGYLIKDINSSVGGGGDMFDGYTTWPLWLPVVGPFVTIATTADHHVPYFLLVPAAVGEVTGFCLLVAGLASTESELVRNESAHARASVTPYLGHGALGLNAAGTF